jgi:Bacterial cadherin-like domain
MMALSLINKGGIWYWSDGNPGDTTSPAALSGNVDGVFLPTDPTSPPIADVVCPRSITFTLPGKPSATVTVVEDAGKLDFQITTPLKADISGLFFDLTNSKLSTLSVVPDPKNQITQFVTGAGGVINLKNGVNLNGRGLPNFDVGMEFGLAGIGNNHQNIQSESFVLSDTAHDLSIDDLHPTGEAGYVGVRDLSVGQKLAAVAPYAPTATPDTVTTLEDTPTIAIPVSALATDKNNGAILTISEIGTGPKGPQYGTVTIAPDGQSLVYTPTTLDYEVDGILTGNKDAFQVCVTDNFGGEVTSFVTVNATPVADTPTVAENIAAPQSGDAATLVRFNVTITSGDFATIDQGSDYIKSLATSLTGTNTNGITVTDSAGLLSGNPMPANQGQLTDQIIVSLPVDSTFSDTLSMTGTNAETENTGQPATAATTISQTITADAETTSEDAPITIPISNLGLGSGMTITQVAPGPLGPKYGMVSIAAGGQSLTYTPTTLDFMVNGTPTGNQDVFQVYSSDGAGHNAVTLLTVHATPVADTPTVNVQVLTPHAGDPATLTRLLVTATSGDFGAEAGSDYIKSLALDLTGNVTGGVTLSDSKGLLDLSTDTITTSGLPGSFTDEIDVTAPARQSINDTLGITAFNDETEGFGSPAEASAATVQPIVIDFSENIQKDDFQAVQQSIWTTGTAFTKDLHSFLGIGTTNGPQNFSGKIGVGALGFGLSAGVTLSVKAGFQVDLHVDSGDLNADLPFQVTLDSTYNKTTDTLVVDPTETGLPGGQISSTGPNGNLEIDLVLQAMVKYFAKATAFGTTVIGIPPPATATSVRPLCPILARKL